MIPNVWVRVIIAVITVVILYAVLPPLFAILAVPQADKIILILRLLIAGAALYYIFKGNIF